MVTIPPNPWRSRGHALGAARGIPGPLSSQNLSARTIDWYAMHSELFIECRGRSVTAPAQPSTTARGAPDRGETRRAGHPGRSGGRPDAQDTEPFGHKKGMILEDITADSEMPRFLRSSSRHSPMSSSERS